MILECHDLVFNSPYNSPFNNYLTGKKENQHQLPYCFKKISIGLNNHWLKTRQKMRLRKSSKYSSN